MAAVAASAAPWQATKSQRAQLVRAYLAMRDALNDGWVRARNHGERPTLASLYYRGLLLRRCHSGAGTTSPAHEYRLHPDVYTQFQQAVQQQVAKGQSAVYRADANGNGGTGMATEEAAAPQAAGGEVVPITKAAQASGTTRGGSGSRKGGAKPKPGGRAKPKPGARSGAAAKKATGAAPAAKKAASPRAVKTSKAAKDARKEMEGHDEAYKAYVQAQAAKAAATKAGNQAEADKQQKTMDKHRAGYTARRAAYRKYQAAPAS